MVSLSSLYGSGGSLSLSSTDEQLKKLQSGFQYGGGGYQLPSTPEAEKNTFQQGVDTTGGNRGTVTGITGSTAPYISATGGMATVPGISPAGSLQTYDGIHKVGTVNLGAPSLPATGGATEQDGRTAPRPPPSPKPTGGVDLGGTGAGAAGSGAQYNDVANPMQPPPQVGTQDLVEDWIRQQMRGGARDTSGEEDLIRRMMERAMGQGVVDSRARAGRFGMAASGAQAGIEGDINRKMADAALERIFGVQQGARDEQFRNQQAGANTWLQFQRNEMDATQQEFMNRIIAQLGGEGAGADTGNQGDKRGQEAFDPASWFTALSSPFSKDAAKQSIWNQIGSAAQGGVATSSQAVQLGYQPYNPNVTDKPPPGEAPPTTTWYYDESTGTFLLVRV